MDRNRAPSLISAIRLSQLTSEIGKEKGEPRATDLLGGMFSNRQNLEPFIVVLNFSGATQSVDITLSTTGQWIDVHNGDAVATTQDYHLYNYPVASNWGYVFWQK